MSPTAAPFDPFADHPTFRYPIGSTVRPAYPLSSKSKVPESIVRPNYARESVSAIFWAYWEVRRRVHDRLGGGTRGTPATPTEV